MHSSSAWIVACGSPAVAGGRPCLARVRAPLGVRLRQRPAAGADDDGVVAPFDELVRVERRTDHGWCWVVGMESMAGRIETYKGAKVRAGLAIWIPSRGFVAQMKAAGMITDGASAFARAGRAMTGAAEAIVDAAAYPAGLVVGLLHGAWNAIADLFVGAADLIEAVAKVAYHVVTANPLAIKDMVTGWVDKLAGAWANRDKLADEFMRKWEADDGWDRGTFRGEVLGWVMMTALIAILTAGEGAAVLMTGRWAHVLRALQTLDALGDVTAYARKIGKLPARAIEHVQHELGRGATRAGRTAGDAGGYVAGDLADEAARGVEGAASHGAGARGREPAMGDEAGTVAADPTIRSSRAAAIYHGAAEVTPRQAKLLAQLPEELSRIIVHKRAVSINDLAALTARTGDEFAVFTQGSRRMIVRGSARGVNLTRAELTALRDAGWKWSGHTHPGTSDLVLNASGHPGDRMVLEIFGQEQSLITNSRGGRSVFDASDDTRVPSGGRR